MIKIRGTFGTEKSQAFSMFKDTTVGGQTFKRFHDEGPVSEHHAVCLV